ncbi:MAG: GIY-YIG nuclease family protein [Faecousia sp.]
MEKPWQLYLLRCGDGTLYTGIAVDAQKRLLVHRSGKGAKYTRGRGPLELVYTETCSTHSEALKRELAVKAMTREEKEALIAKGHGQSRVFCHAVTERPMEPGTLLSGECGEVLQGNAGCGKEQGSGIGILEAPPGENSGRRL